MTLCIGCYDCLSTYSVYINLVMSTVSCRKHQPRVTR